MWFEILASSSFQDSGLWLRRVNINAGSIKTSGLPFDDQLQQVVSLLAPTVHFDIFAATAKARVASAGLTFFSFCGRHEGDALDFDARSQRQSACGQRAAGGEVRRENLAIDRVESRPFLDVRQEDRALHNVLQ